MANVQFPFGFIVASAITRFTDMSVNVLNDTTWNP